MSEIASTSRLRLPGMRRLRSWEDRILRRIRAARRARGNVANWSDRELREGRRQSE